MRWRGRRRALSRARSRNSLTRGCGAGRAKTAWEQRCWTVVARPCAVSYRTQRRAALPRKVVRAGPGFGQRADRDVGGGIGHDGGEVVEVGVFVQDDIDQRVVLVPGGQDGGKHAEGHRQQGGQMQLAMGHAGDGTGGTGRALGTGQGVAGAGQEGAGGGGWCPVGRCRLHCPNCPLGPLTRTTGCAAS